MTKLLAGNQSVFATLMEQNFARMSQRNLLAYMQTITDVELCGLARDYASATLNRADRPFMLDVLACRLSSGDLGRLAGPFGFAPVYEAIQRQAPAKLNEFSDTAVVSRGLPELFQFLTMTPSQLYNSFRAAPGQSVFGVSAALFSTVTTYGAAISYGWDAGYNFGTNTILPLVQTYAPNFYIGLGGTINEIIEGYRNADLNSIGIQEEESTPSFNLQPIAYNYFEQTGGAYGVTSEWYSAAGGGGCRNTVAPQRPLSRIRG